jgi:ATP-dependent Clp protease ATP-binding subunit ClpA
LLLLNTFLQETNHATKATSKNAHLLQNDTILKKLFNLLYLLLVDTALDVVLSLAREEALSFNHQYIGTEHLLVGLLRKQEGLAALALKKLGVALDPVRAAVEEKIGRVDQPVQEEIDYVPRARKVLSLALDEAERQGQPLV